MRWYKGWIETIRLAIRMNQSCKSGIHLTVDGQCWCERRKTQTISFQTAEFDYDE